MEDPTNTNRAEWAEEAIVAFQKVTGTDRCDALCDLLCDLRHWADREGFSFKDEMKRGNMHYNAEVREEGKCSPQHPKEMDEDAFIARFKPEHDAEGNAYIQREYPKDKRAIDRANREGRLWTMVEAGDSMCLESGYHFVNRLYYVICEVPYDGEPITVTCD